MNETYDDALRRAAEFISGYARHYSADVARISLVGDDGEPLCVVAAVLGRDDSRKLLEFLDGLQGAGALDVTPKGGGR